jgi:hypothetical protein
VCVCVRARAHFRHCIKCSVIASVVADVQLLHSRLKSWLGHECVFTFYTLYHHVLWFYVYVNCKL